VEKYKRPALVLADEGGKVKGSVRSVDGVHVVELLKGVQDHLERYGGHAKAGGLTLKGKDVTRFQAALALWAVERGIGLNAMAATMVREADADLNLPDVTLELAHALAALEPYGLGFERPLFRSNVRLENIRIVGVGGKHLSCQLKQGRAQVKGIGFGLGGEKIELGKEYMVWYTVRTEEWQGKQSLSCQIERIAS
jgi:single-stranded-DNA-specific exonuclease